MGNLNAVAQGDLALAGVTFTAGTPAYSSNRGFAAAITDNGVGDVTLVLSNEQNLVTAANVQVSIRGALPGLISWEAVSTTGIRIRTWSCSVGMDADTAAADLDFQVRITPLAPV